MKSLCRLIALLVVCVGCSPSSAPKYDLGDKVVVDNTVGIVISKETSGKGDWFYQVRLRGATIYYKEDKLQLQERMNWDEPPCLSPEHNIKIEGVPSIPGMPTLAPSQTTKPTGDKTTLYWDERPALLQNIGGLWILIT